MRKPLLIPRKLSRLCYTSACLSFLSGRTRFGTRSRSVSGSGSRASAVLAYVVARNCFGHADPFAVCVCFVLKSLIRLTDVSSSLDVQDLAELVKEVVGYEGELKWDTTKPDGTPRKLMDNSKIASLGWTAKISLKEGLTGTYKWYLENYVNGNMVPQSH